MSFSSGTISLRRFSVVGNQPKTIEQSHLDRMAEHMLTDDRPLVELDYGWSGGRHVLDTQLDFEHSVYNDAISAGIRVDINRVPASLRRAYRIMEEDALAAANPSGFLSKKQKAGIKETLSVKMDEELRSGQHRRSRLTPVLWDFPRKTIYSPATAKTIDCLSELIDRTYEFELEQLTAGTLAKRMMHGHKRDYEDLRPTRFVPGQGGEGEYPEYPWTAKGPQPKDFLGNEFLLWLWHEADVQDGTIEMEKGEATVFFDRALDLDCAFGQSGRAILHAAGPHRMPEAREAIRSGKVPRRTGMLLDLSAGQFSLTLSAESLAIASLKLPDVKEAESPRVLFEERIALLREVCDAVDGMFGQFLKVRASSNWESQTGAIRKWILQTARPAMAVA